MADAEWLRRSFRIEACDLLLLGLCLLAPGASHADTLTGRVVHIADGDTITVLDDGKTQHRVRLGGIDAPEKGQAFGHTSRQHLADLVAGQRVDVEWYKRDRYGRIVGKVLREGRDVCLEQVRAGMAWHFRKYAAEQSPEDRKVYAKAEEQARASKAGLWSDVRAVPPW
jgi:endonuclease YncB( thermonuclease family)